METHALMVPQRLAGLGDAGGRREERPDRPQDIKGCLCLFCRIGLTHTWLHAGEKGTI